MDYLALGWYFLCWIGYALAANHKRWRDRSMASVMAGYRLRWMFCMLGRDNRMLDANILGNLLNGAAFFASTTILAVGGLFALLGASDKAVEILSDLPFATPTSSSAWQIKVLLLVAVLVYAFFKFAWTFRLYNYCSVLIGAAPAMGSDDPESETMARRATLMSTLAARHSNGGLRAYYFALAALGWFIHPLLFMAASIWVVYVMFRRDFRSRSLRSVRDPITGSPGELP